MAYNPVVWVNDVTPLNAAYLNQMDQGIVALDNGKVDRDATVTAATRLVTNKLLQTDTQPAFTLSGDGTIRWGPGGATGYDTNLYRLAAGVLKTDGQLRLASSFYANEGGTTQVAIGNDGKIYFASTADTNLYRSAASTLKTDGSFIAAGGVMANQGGVGTQVYAAPSGILYFGSAGDTTLYRSAAGVLTTDGKLIAGLLQASAGATRVEAGNIYDGTKACVVLGGDTNLYRSAAGVLQTDGSFHAVGGVSLLSGADTVELHGELVRAGAAIKALKLRINGVAYKIDLKPA